MPADISFKQVPYSSTTENSEPNHSVEPTDRKNLLVYVCLVNELNINQASSSANNTDKRSLPKINIDDDSEEIVQSDKDDAKHIERTNGIHNIKGIDIDNGNIKIKSDQSNNSIVDTDTETESSLIEDAIIKNSRVLRLTRMDWLTDGHDGSPNASLHSIHSSISSISSQDSTNNAEHDMSRSDKCLSTILALDKEHNMFGLSSLDISMEAPLPPIRKKSYSKPVFHQTAIVQVCSVCCKRNYSKTGVPAGLTSKTDCRWGPCTPCPEPCGKPKCRPCGPPAVCAADLFASCCGNYGFQLSVDRKLDYKPDPVILSPRASCELIKPLAARTCPHCPTCQPPSSCFPYLMPCFWPAREGAPCSHPERCFHNPKCPAPRQRFKSVDIRPCPQYCGAAHFKGECPNKSCLAKNKLFREAFTAAGQENIAVAAGGATASGKIQHKRPSEVKKK